MSEYIITIDQAKIDAPAFPRSSDWWTSFLPGWFSDSQCMQKWMADKTYTPDWSNLTIDPTSRIISIIAENRKHAGVILNWLIGLTRLAGAVELTTKSM